MTIIKMIFNESQNTCEMLNGSNRLELYTYDEGEIVLTAMQSLRMLNVISLDVQYK